MKVLRNCIRDTFVDSMACDRNFSHNPFLLVGNESNATTKTIMTIDTMRIYEMWRKYRVNKVELCMFLKDVRYCSNRKSFVLKLRTNISDINIRTVTYDTCPRVSRISYRYKVSNRCIGKYVYFDITAIIKKWIVERVCNFGITILADEGGYLAAFQSTQNRMKPFIRVSYSKNYCRQSEFDIPERERELNSFCCSRDKDDLYSDEFINTNESYYRDDSTYDNDIYEYNRQKNKYKKDIKDAEEYINYREDYKYEEYDSYLHGDREFRNNIEIADEEHYNNAELLEASKEDFLREIEEFVKVGSEKSYGCFINLSTKLVQDNNGQYVYWDTKSVCNNVEVLRDKTTILVRSKGVYKIDYYMNVRTEEFTTMEIVVNDVPIDISRTQIGGNENPSSGQIIINIDEDNSEISLMINTQEAVLVNVGKACCISIIEV